MTDNEIIKALKGNILNAKSIDCKVWSVELYKIEEALDLINRQNAEIEELYSDKIIAETHEKAAKDLFV